MSTETFHFIGIGGIGMSGLARILLGKKAEVSGSDLSHSYVTEGLEKEGAKVFIGHSAQYIKPNMTVVYTTDVKESNPEFAAAKSLQCKMLHRSDLLTALMQPFKTLAVAGTHGKTTTSALLSSVLVSAGLDPAYAVGGIIPQLKSNGGHGKGEYFVAEADESDGTFLKYSPYGAIITNIDLDHMDHFKTEKNLVDAFLQFFAKVQNKESLIWCGDDDKLFALKQPGISYGFNPHCDWRISKFRQSGWQISYDLEYRNKHFADVQVALTGRHNALNSAAVFALAYALGVPEAEIRKAFIEFKGVGRRAEKKGERGGVLFLDDYAHHPTEIATTLKAIKDAVGERRLIAIFQPHRYTRTQSCLGTFGNIFDDADEVVITDIFAARETPIPGLTHEQPMEEIKRSSHIPCRYVARGELAEHLSSYLRPFDVVVTLGAGDITKLSGEVLDKLSVKPVAKLKVGVVFGGRSAEHEVSIKSYRNLIPNFDAERYQVTHFGIKKDGSWISCETSEKTIEALQQKNNNTQQVSPEILQKLNECDLIFPILHGAYGEDGTIQGFFEMLGKPYIGCGCTASGMGMDKVVMKKLALYNHLPVVPFVDFSSSEWKENRDSYLQEIASKLRYPLFVKPAHLGSTLGITKVEKEEQLLGAIQTAFKLDTHVIVETGIESPREIEFAVMGNDKITILPPGEILAEGQVHDYEGKYGGDKAHKNNPKAELPKHLVEEGTRITEIIYKALGCTGFTRMDFFLDKQNNLWFNEANTLPGCTPFSLYPRICQANGMTLGEMIDRLIVLGLERKRQRDRVF